MQRSGPNPKVLPTVSYEILICSCWIFPMMENEAGDGVKAKQAVPILSTAMRKFLGGITNDTSPISLQKWKDTDGIAIVLGRLKQVSNKSTLGAQGMSMVCAIKASRNAS